MSNLRNSKLLLLSFITTTLLAFTTALFANAESESVLSSNSLTLTTDKKHLKVYLKPGVSLSGYKALQVAPVKVAFKDNWMKKYNRNHKALAERINEKEADMLKGRVQKQFDLSFPKYLVRDSRLSISTESSQQALVLKPVITELVINAPDLNNAMRKHQYVRQVGSATLTVEIYDAATGQLLGKLVSEEETIDNFRMTRTNRVVNNSEFIRVYRLWAQDVIAIL